MTGGVDGSPSTADAFIVDPTGNGTNHAWRTLLAVPDYGYSGGTLDVLDVTNPTNPIYLWTASDTYSVSGKSYVMGRAQGAAISPVMTASGVKFAYFVLTENTNGTWGNGFNLYALDAGTGSVLWRFNHTYANDTTHNDVPGVAAIIDDAGDGGPVNKATSPISRASSGRSTRATERAAPPCSMPPPNTRRRRRSIIRSRAASGSIAIRRIRI